MGNTTNNNVTNSAPPSPSSRWTISRQNSTNKQIHISTNHPDGFYFTGERLTGTVRIPTALHHHIQHKTEQNPREMVQKRSLRSAIIIELVGDATYSAEVDVAADSDGHSTHKVNLCRHRCIVSMNSNKPETAPTSLTSSLSSPSPSSDTNSLVITPPTEINGTFQLQIPENLPPSLTNNGRPSVVYTLELSLSSSRYRYQIPLTLSSRGCIPHALTDIEISTNAINKSDIHLVASLPRTFYRPGEQIPIRINFSNPQKRYIRSITIRLVQFYRVHNDQNQFQLDGKEWAFDILNMLPQREWLGEGLLQLPAQQLAASYPLTSAGTTQIIQCELDYRILIELNEKKGDDIHLQLPSIQVTYQE